MTVLDEVTYDPTSPAGAPTWQPEDDYIGALLHLTAGEARDLVQLVPPTAIVQPIARWAYELIGALVERGDTPAPTAVLANARHQPPASEANIIGPLTVTALRPSILADLGTYLANALTRVPDITAGRRYATDVLDLHFRRTAATWGQRLQQMAGADADRRSLTAAITGMRGELADLWWRAEHAGNPDRR